MRNLFAIAILLVGICLIGYSQLRTDLRQERVWLSKDSVDFGVRQTGENLRVELGVVNDTKDAITCGPVMHGCSCIDATITPNILQPGQTGKLIATWSLRGKRGRVSEQFLFTYSGRIKGHCVGRIFVTALAPVQAESETIQLSENSTEKEIRFFSGLNRDFRLISSTSSHAAVGCALSSDSKSIRVTFDPTKPGWRSGHIWVVVTTDQLDEPEIRLSVRVVE
jgi:hypothetical protein